VIAERHDKFLSPTFYQLLAVVLASREDWKGTGKTRTPAFITSGKTTSLRASNVSESRKNLVTRTVMIWICYNSRAKVLTVP